MISFMEKQEDIWDIKDKDSRIIYANKAVFSTSCLPMNFSIEGKKNC
uniref:Phage transcriptional regulator n=1 Tax=Arsenophonus nasoniae TaxID=638 RepID=D2U4L9_9GAMM|nr:phage transcriptional regulator [Arsenophonus nasoniae]